MDELNQPESTERFVPQDILKADRIVWLLTTPEASEQISFKGEVNLLRASIGGYLDCSGGKFSNKGNRAITANTAKIASSVLLCNDFKAEGEVDLAGASIGGGAINSKTTQLF